MKTHGVIVAALLFGLMPSNSLAQVKPKIYILFDTSGSMLQDTTGVFQNGDGSPLCTNDGVNSRVAQLKVALFDALQGMGASEVDFALATFPMYLDPNRTPYCAIGQRNACTNNGDCVRPGEQCQMQGWPPSLKCLSPCASQPACSGHYYTDDQTISENSFNDGSVRYGCKISTHDPATQQVGTCGDASNPCSGWYSNYKQEVLKVPFGNPPEEVMYYFDQQEDHPLSQNPEVRVGNGWWTPLGKSLFYAHGYFHKEVALPAGDFRKKCERLVIAFFTDGGETCNTTTSDPFWPSKWAAELLKLGVVTHTVAIDTSVPLLSDIASNGGGSYVQVSGSTAELKKAFLDIIAESLPPAEICNGEDDDCDNEIDEDFPLKGTPCSNGLKGACFRQGSYVCTADGLGVVCDAAAATGTDEVCNGIDDDCDGEVDEIPGCIPCVPQPEVCNGMDDDCDTEIDEEIPSAPCGSTVGECSPGMTKCENGKTICDGGQGPTEEICDGLDNDCDTQRDGILDLCYPFEQGCDIETGTCEPDSQCALGTRRCDAKELSPDNWIGEWGDCTGAVGPDPEICDGIDNDCDGEVDEQAECPGESQCINGMCTSPCAGGEFVCPSGQVCTNGWCVLDTCNPTTCKEQGGICKSGECYDPCQNVDCAKFQKCVFGQCVDDSCYEAHPCPSDEACVQGECVKDPCKGKLCSSEEFCLDGECHTLCEAMECPEGQICQLVGEAGSQTTKCVETACAKPCDTGYVCVDGKCEVDPCEATPCETHEICISGKCFADPCEKIDCPATHVCKQGRCVANIQALTEILATGGGGCACGVAGEAPGGMLVLLTLLALLLSDRRRRRQAKR